MEAHQNLDALGDAFASFREASAKLEGQYAALEKKIEDLNRELAEKNRAMERHRRLAAMGEMAAKIAHEIRNPLGSISIFATLLERDLSDDPVKSGYAGRISRGVKTLDNILSNMLLFASSPEARRAEVDLRDVVEESVAMARGRGGKGVTVETCFDGETIVEADRSLMTQLLVNLILNAVDAVDEGGRVRVETGPGGDGEMEIRVADDGRGIPDDVIDRIFDPFFSTKERGTGLGMAIVSAVVEAHGAGVDVSSEEGKGTEFTVRLPGEGLINSGLSAANGCAAIFDN